jgi:hypothetical protein
VADIDWMDRTSSWWAKMDHAKKHADALHKIVSDYEATKPIRIEPEPIGDEIAYRLHISRPVPIEISLMIGDILHNVRSALDALMFGLVGDEATGPLSDQAIKASKFPVCSSPEEYQDFWSRRHVIPSDRLRPVLRHAQPFLYMEEGKKLGVEYSETYEEFSKGSTLWWVDHLNIVDKHRQLTVAAWWPGLTYWGSDEGQAPQYCAMGAGASLTVRYSATPVVVAKTAPTM